MMSEHRPWLELPCREFCNAYKHGCERGRCCQPYTRDDPRYWLGRGQESVPSKPFGWAHEMERQAIRDHLKARGRYRSELDVIPVQMRLHRDYHRRKPPIGVRRIVAAPVRSSTDLNREQLEHIVSLWADANDPTSRAIAAWAAERIESGAG